MAAACACTDETCDSPSSPRPRIVLADDHRAMRESVRRLLASDFDIVAEVENGWTAIEAVDVLRPDVLVLDVSMPKLSGIEAAERLRSSGCGTRIVFLTVHDDADYARDALATGATGYVVKPRMVSELVKAIHCALKGQQFVSPSVSFDQPL